MKVFKFKTTYVATTIAIVLCLSLALLIACPMSASAATVKVDNTESAFGVAPLLDYTTPLQITAEPLGSGRYKINVFVDIRPLAGTFMYVDQICIYWSGYTVEASSPSYTNSWYSGTGGTGVKKNTEDSGTYSRIDAFSYICFPLDVKATFMNGWKIYNCESSQLRAEFIIEENGLTKSKGVRGAYLHKIGPGVFDTLSITISDDGEHISLGGGGVGIFHITDNADTTL